MEAASQRINRSASDFIVAGHTAAAAVVLTSDEIGNADLRQLRAESLFPRNQKESIAAARQFLDLMAAAASEKSRSSAEIALLKKQRDMECLQNEVIELSQKVYSQRAEKERLQKNRDALWNDLGFERERIVRLVDFMAEWRENYFSFVVGGRNPGANEFGMLGNIQNAKTCIAFTRDEVIPELERRLAEAEAAVAAFVESTEARGTASE